MHPNTTTNRFSYIEEKANSISHGVGLLLSLIALVSMVLMVKYSHGSNLHLISALIFGGGLCLMFLTSVLNHSLPAETKSKDFFHNFDQISVYVLIASSYTPMALIALSGTARIVMMSTVYGIAIVGILIKLFTPNHFKRGTNSIVIFSYLIQGWIIVFYLPILYSSIGATGMNLILAGGVIYSLGIIFYKLEKQLKHNHLIWHIFVLLGSFCTWFSIWRFVLPINL